MRYFCYLCPRKNNLNQFKLRFIMFEGQPKGLWALALANTGERFGYYTMLAVFTLFLQANFQFDEKLTSTIFSSFLMLVYFLPLFGGMLADKFGYSKMVTVPLKTPGDFVGKWICYAKNISTFNIWNFLVAIGSLLVIIFSPKAVSKIPVLNKIPGSLFGIVLGRQK